MQLSIGNFCRFFLDAVATYAQKPLPFLLVGTIFVLRTLFGGQCLGLVAYCLFHGKMIMNILPTVSIALS